jgi:hypothetical protein
MYNASIQPSVPFENKKKLENEDIAENEGFYVVSS